MRITIFIILAALCAASCRPIPGGGDNPVSPDVYRRWHQGNSYYALIEIVDAHLANRPDHNRATKLTVIKHLGEPNWGTVNQDPERVWAYQGFGRHVPYGDKIIFTFSETDALIGMEWVSE